MSLLGNIGHWLRNETDNVGSLVTGQPAHSAPQPQPTQPSPQPPTPQPAQPAFHQAITSMMMNKPNAPFQAGPSQDQASPAAATPPPKLNLSLNHNGLLPNRNALLPHPIANSPNALTPATVAKGVGSGLINTAKAPYDAGRVVVAGISGNPTAQARATQALINSANNSLISPLARTAELGGQAFAERNIVNNPNTDDLTKYNQLVAADNGNKTGISVFDNPATSARKELSLGAQDVLTPALLAIGAGGNMVKSAATNSVVGSGLGGLSTLDEQNPNRNDLIRNTLVGGITGASLPLVFHGAAEAADAGIKAAKATKQFDAAQNQIGSLGENANKPEVIGNFVHTTDANGNLVKIPKNQWDFKAGLPKEISQPIPTHYDVGEETQAMHDAGMSDTQISKATARMEAHNAKLDATQPTPAVSAEQGANAPKGLILSETKPQADGSKIVIRRTKDADGKVQLVQQKVDKNTDQPFVPANNLDADSYANAFGISKLQAQKDLADMANGESKVQHLTPEELAKLSPEERLSPKQKRELIQNDARQQTINQLELRPEEGSAKSAIANATALADERDARLAEAPRLGSKLDDHDKALLYRYDAGEKIDDLAKEAHKPDTFSQAAHSAADALDYSLAAQRAGDAPVLKQHNYIPHNYEASQDWLDQKKIPEDQRIKIGKEVKGFRDIHAKYGSYAEASAHGLKPLFKNPFEDIADYAKGGSTKTRNNLLQASLAKALPNDIAPIDTVSLNGQHFKPAAGGNLPFAVSEKLDKQLQGFKQAWSPNSKAGQLAEGAIKLTGRGTKKALFALSFFHQAHIAENVNLAALLGREPGVIGNGIIDEVKATGGLSKGSYYRLMDRARQDGTTEYARRMGLTYQPDSALGRFVDVYANQLAKAAKEGGIPAGSQTAVDLGTIYNRILGRDNSLVEGRNPTIEKFTSYFALAPHYLRSQLRLVADAFLPKKLGGAGYDKAFKLTSPGGAARSAVIGPRVLGALLAVTASAIVMHKFPSWQDAKREAGLQGNNTNPNIKIRSKNSKGEGQVMNLPTDPIGLALGFVTDPTHFFQSRYSPALSFATKEITNTNWNGQPLSDPNQPNALLTRTKNAALNSVTPIGLQNFTNLQNNKSNPNIQQGAAQEVGFRLKTDPNDPQVQANKQYFNNFKQAQDDLKKNNGQYGQYWSNVFNSLHPANTTDASGNKYPTPFNPLSSEAKYAAYSAVDSKGNPQLSPVFYADKNLANSTPGYPSSPLYKLNGTGIDAEGRQAPQALVALQYQHNQDPAAKTVIMNANGGQNGWLGKYEGQVADYSKNYQGNLTNYFKSLGWNDKAINDYWSKHPSTEDPIDNLTFDKPTQDLLQQYYDLSASGDSTAASTFFSQHAQTLGDAMDQTAQHSNAIRAAKGELQIQGYPQENDHVRAVLDGMPQGSDKASKKARALAIQGNPDVNQYLADVALYNTLGKSAQFRYKNPANMAASEGQNINNGGKDGQTFLKDVVSLGQYDIGKNAAGNYEFMQNGGFSDGTAAGSTGGSKGYASKKKTPYAPKIKTHKIRVTYRKKPRVFLKKPASPIKIKNKVDQHPGIHITKYM